VVVVTIYWLFLFKGETDIGSLWFNLVVHGMESRGNMCNELQSWDGSADE
jgi:hypothetical protein